MISLRISATKLVNKNEPEEIPKEFPSRRVLAMNYTRCCTPFFIHLLLVSRQTTHLHIPFCQLKIYNQRQVQNI